MGAVLHDIDIANQLEKGYINLLTEAKMKVEVTHIEERVFKEIDKKE